VEQVIARRLGETLQTEPRQGSGGIFKQAFQRAFQHIASIVIAMPCVTFQRQI
jgi:hypothetical protein